MTLERERHLQDLEHLNTTPRIPKKPQADSDSEGERVDHHNRSLVPPSSFGLQRHQEKVNRPLTTYGARSATGKDSLLSILSVPSTNRVNAPVSTYKASTSALFGASLPTKRDDAIAQEVQRMNNPSRGAANMQAPRKTFVSPEILQENDPHGLYTAHATQRTTRSAKKVAKKEPETVDLLSSGDEDDGCTALAAVDVATEVIPAYVLASRRVYVPPSRFPLDALHFGLLEITSNNDHLCTLAMLGSANDMLWRFHWYIEGESKATDINADAIVSYRYVSSPTPPLLSSCYPIGLPHSYSRTFLVLLLLLLLLLLLSPVSYRDFVDKETDLAYVALELRPNVVLEHVPVGRDFILNPEGNPQDLDKYIILTMSNEHYTRWTQEVKQFYPSMIHHGRRDRRVKLWDNHLTRQSMPYEMLQGRMARELSESQAKQERLARRRRAAAAAGCGAGGYTKDDPEDSITFVVYPIEPEAPVRACVCVSCLLSLVSNRCL